MEQRFDKLERLIESLYAFTKGESEFMRGEFKYLHEKFTAVDERFDRIEVRLERIENKVDNNHENRVTRLEDSMRVVKTKLGFN